MSRFSFVEERPDSGGDDGATGGDPGDRHRAGAALAELGERDLKQASEPRLFSGQKVHRREPKIEYQSVKIEGAICAKLRSREPGIGDRGPALGERGARIAVKLLARPWCES